MALDLAIALGAVWTTWSVVTDALFVLGGLIVAVLGLNRTRRKHDGDACV